MRTICLLLFLVINLQISTQEVEKIIIPEGIVYYYCSPEIYKNVKEIVKKELSVKHDYSLCDNTLDVGPVLWSRFGKIETLANIECTKLVLWVDDIQLLGKEFHTLQDSKKVWDELCKELRGEKYILRKATPNELIYYWSIISFDIEEPLIIVETKRHNYILNISAETRKLKWLDEAPSDRQKAFETLKGNYSDVVSRIVKTERNSLSRITYSIGYYNSIALMTASGLVSIVSNSDNETDYRFVLDKLKNKTEILDIEKTIRLIEKFSLESGWQLSQYTTELRNTIGRENIYNFLLKTINDYPDNNEMRIQTIERFGAKINKFSSSLFSEIKNASFNTTETAMIYVGNNIGEIDQLMQIAQLTNVTENAIPYCREYIKELLTVYSNPAHKLDKILTPVFDEFPNLNSRVESLNEFEIMALVKKFKENFLSE